MVFGQRMARLFLGGSGAPRPTRSTMPDLPSAGGERVRLGSGIHPRGLEAAASAPVAPASPRAVPPVERRAHAAPSASEVVQLAAELGATSRQGAPLSELDPATLHEARRELAWIRAGLRSVDQGLPPALEAAVAAGRITTDEVSLAIAKGAIAYEEADTVPFADWPTPPPIVMPAPRRGPSRVAPSPSPPAKAAPPSADLERRAKAAGEMLQRFAGELTSFEGEPIDPTSAARLGANLQKLDGQLTALWASVGPEVTADSHPRLVRAAKLLARLEVAAELARFPAAVEVERRQQIAELVASFHHAVDAPVLRAAFAAERDDEWREAREDLAYRAEVAGHPRMACALRARGDGPLDEERRDAHEGRLLERASRGIGPGVRAAFRAHERSCDHAGLALGRRGEELAVRLGAEAPPEGAVELEGLLARGRRALPEAAADVLEQLRAAPRDGRLRAELVRAMTALRDELLARSPVEPALAHAYARLVDAPGLDPTDAAAARRAIADFVRLTGGAGVEVESLGPGDPARALAAAPSEARALFRGLGEAAVRADDALAAADRSLGRGGRADGLAEALAVFASPEDMAELALRDRSRFLVGLGAVVARR